MQLIRNIQGDTYPNVVDNINYLSTISGDVQREDYVNLNGFVGFLQNLTKAEETAVLSIPSSFGLANTNNKTIVTLEISY